MCNFSTFFSNLITYNNFRTDPIQNSILVWIQCQFRILRYGKNVHFTYLSYGYFVLFVHMVIISNSVCYMRFYNIYIQYLLYVFFLQGGKTLTLISLRFQLRTSVISTLANIRIQTFNPCLRAPTGVCLWLNGTK